MSKLQLNYILFIFLGLLISCNSKEIATVIKVNQTSLTVNGEPYIIKGICYHPVPKGSSERSFETLNEDLKLMKEAGINTIRVYAPIDDVEVLNTINKAGLKVIIGFGYDQKGFYDIKSGSFINYVNTYKNHNAILFWELGNEYNYHPEWFNGDINNWYTALKEASELIHKNDSNHPVATAHGDLPTDEVLKAVPNIDIWGLNVYRWDNPSTIIKEWKSKSYKPIYFSEAGADSYMTITKDGYEKGENQKAQADATDKILHHIFSDNETSIGVTLFSFTDGWWKAGDTTTQDIGGWAPNSSGVPYDGSPNEEYWGIVDIDRNKKEAFKAVQKHYKKQ